MYFLSILLFSLSANLDSFIIGISYGIKNIKISFTSNLLIGAITAIGTFLSMAFGKFLLQFFPVEVSKFIGSFILIVFGIRVVIKELLSKKEKESLKAYDDIKNILKEPESADKDFSGVIELKESWTLGLALTINNVALGIGGSLSGLPIILTSLFCLAFCILLVMLGHFTGRKFLRKSFSKNSEIISGIILIVLGIYELFM